VGQFIAEIVGRGSGGAEKWILIEEDASMVWSVEEKNSGRLVSFGIYRLNNGLQ
jgi:hypothetical protein